MVMVGGVNVVQTLIQTEMRIAVLEKIVEILINAKPATERHFSIDMETLRTQALEDLQKKYPNLGINNPNPQG